MSAAQQTFMDIPAAAGDFSPVDMRDRRRPGRVEDVSSQLIPLLRGSPPGAPEPNGAEADFRDDPPLLGLALGVLFSIPLWAVAGLILWVQFG